MPTIFCPLLPVSQVWAGLEHRMVGSANTTLNFLKFSFFFSSLAFIKNKCPGGNYSEVKPLSGNRRQKM